MNFLIHQEYFHVTLNQFLAIDKDLIPWKLTCNACYYYPHNIHIMHCDVKKCKNVLKNTKIIEIDTRLYLEKTNIYWFIECECGLSNHIITSFDLDFLSQDLPDLKILKMSYMNYSSDIEISSIVSKLTTLEYLDLGINTHLANYCFENLTNLKVLYLRNNCNTSEIFKYLPNLHTVQIGYEIDRNIFYIQPKQIPQYVTKIIEIGYSYECPVRGWQDRDGCEPLYQHEEYILILKPEKN